MSETSLPGTDAAGTPPASTPVVATSGRAAALVAAGIIVSRVFGLLRTWAFARFFGLSIGGDAYNAAIKIPNFVRALLGEGAISASFIPVYSGALGRGDERGARELAGALLGLLLVAVSILTIAGIAAAPLLAALLAGGLDEEGQRLTARLIRVMFPMTGLMVLSGWCLGIQNSHRRFFISYASAAVWSLAQIVLLFGWGERAGGDTAILAWWLAWATLAGAALQVLTQLPQVLALVRPLRPSLDWRAGGMQKTLRNFLPVVVTLGFVQISGFIDLRIASHLPTGAITALGYASQLYTLPVSVFGMSVAASSLPDFARDSIGALDTLRGRLQAGWVRILFYIIPTTVVLLVFGDLVVELFLRSGVFASDDVEVTYLILATYSIGLIGYTTARLLASAFYAMQDYRTPLRASIAAIITSAVLAFWFARPFDTLERAAGIALGSALGSYVNFTLLAAGLRGRLGPLFTAAMWKGVARVVGATALATLGAYAARLGLESATVTGAIASTPFARVPPHLIVAPGTLIAFGGIFLLSAYATGSQEAARWVRRARITRRSPPR